VSRHPNIKHYLDIQNDDNAHYPNSSEKLSVGSSFGEAFGLKKLGIHHQLLPPGRRTSWPHAESDEEEFVYVIEGHPHVWLNGKIYQLKPGDGVGFPAGTGLCHTFINNSQENVRLLVSGEKSRKPNNKLVYPLHPKRNEEIGNRYWENSPVTIEGNHDGLPDALRNKNTSPTS